MFVVEQAKAEGQKTNGQRVKEFGVADNWLNYTVTR